MDHLLYPYSSGFINAVSPDAADRLLAYLLDDKYMQWERRENVPRAECWMNDDERPYTYGSGAGIRTYEGRPWNSLVEVIRSILLTDIGVRFEGCFLNRYDQGSDALDWHADDDPGIDHSKPIAIISLGQERALHVRDNERTYVDRFMLGHGSLLLMPPGSQQTHQHKIPKSGLAPEAIKPRISMTFRSLLPKE